MESMTIMTETLSLLRWHAGLDQKGPTDRPSIATVTWKPAHQKNSIDLATTEVLALLEKVNYELNGSKPSEDSGKALVISRQLVFAIEELRRMLREAAHKCEERPDRDALVKAEARITCAWSAVVAGDIDNIRSYVDEQTRGKN